MANDRPADNRKSLRSKTYAKVLIEEANALGYLRDLSREGCQLALLAPLTPGHNEAVTIRILPEPEIGIPAFQMALEVRWSRPSPPYFLLGGTSRPIGEGAAAGALEKLLRYYAG